MRPSTGTRMPLKARLERVGIILQEWPQTKVLRTILIFNMRPGYLPHRKYHHLAVLNHNFASSNNNFRDSKPRQSLNRERGCNVTRNSVSDRSD